MNANRKQATFLVVGALLLTLMSGCGRTPTGVDDPSADPTGGTGTVTPTTDPNYNPGGTTGGGGIFNPGGGGTVTPATPVQVQATITDKTMKRVWYTLFITKKIASVTVQLQNPSNQNVTGKCTVTFSKSGQQVETVDQPFTLSGGQTTTIQVSPTKTADDAVAVAQADPPVGSSGSTTGGSTGWPSTGSGSGSTGWPASTGGTSF